ncbi:F-box/kelch-repeat protein [Trifolium pratense]|uniref:F-box/kelch-repeat protein n=2 Tax=Trifolium TaxID=3898 RepID=A0A2K3NHL0_TRIPR|nr:F-box/kelch-repeat protein [Trifolium pratense]
MNPSLTKTERHRQKRSEWRRRQAAAPESTIYLPFDLIKEVLPFLPVKSLIRLKCVSKPFNSFISDPTFFEKHFNRSSRNVMLIHTKMDSWHKLRYAIAKSLVFTADKPSMNVSLTKNLYYQRIDKDRECRYVIGSCNGLICLFFRSWDRYNWWDNPPDLWWYLRVWNPATRTISDKLGYYPDEPGAYQFNFTFGLVFMAAQLEAVAAEFNVGQLPTKHC